MMVVQFGLAIILRVLVLRSGLGQRQIALCCGESGLAAIVGGLGLVAFLLGNHALLVEVFHALVGLFGDGDGGLSLCDHVGGGLYDLRAGAGIDLTVLCARHFLHGLGLGKLCLDYTRVYSHQSVAGVDGIALLDKKFDYAAGQFARNAHCGAFDLSLDKIVGTVEAQESNHCDYGGGDHHQPHGHE